MKGGFFGSSKAAHPFISVRVRVTVIDNVIYFDICYQCGGVKLVKVIVDGVEYAPVEEKESNNVVFSGSELFFDEVPEYQFFKIVDREGRPVCSGHIAKSNVIRENFLYLTSGFKFVEESRSE